MFDNINDIEVIKKKKKPQVVESPKPQTVESKTPALGASQDQTQPMQRNVGELARQGLTGSLSTPAPPRGFGHGYDLDKYAFDKPRTNIPRPLSASSATPSAPLSKRTEFKMPDDKTLRSMVETQREQGRRPSLWDDVKPTKNPFEGREVKPDERHIKAELDKAMASGNFRDTPEERYKLIEGYYTQDELRQMAHPDPKDPRSYEAIKERRSAMDMNDEMRMLKRDLVGRETAKMIPQRLKDMYEPGVTIRGGKIYRKFLEGPLSGVEYLEEDPQDSNFPYDPRDPLGVGSPDKSISQVRQILNQMGGGSGKSSENYADVGGERKFLSGEYKGMSIPHEQILPGSEFAKQYKYNPKVPGGYEERKDLDKKYLPVKYKTEGFEGTTETPGFYDPQQNKWVYSPKLGGDTSTDTSTDTSVKEGGQKIDIRTLMGMGQKERESYLDNLQRKDPMAFLELSRKFLSLSGEQK